MLVFKDLLILNYLGDLIVKMKQLLTIGYKNYKGYEIPLYVGKDDAFNAQLGFKERFKIIFVDEGSGILKIGAKRQMFIAPVVFCFNENDYYNLENENNLKAHTIWFHPSIINNSLDFNSVRKSDEELTETQRQDAFWLDVFTRKQKDFGGQQNLGPSTAKRVGNLFESIGKELEEQNDTHWPCRGRTFLIELLFLLSRIVSVPEAFENITFNNDPGDIGEILIYLFSNYMRKITIDELVHRFNINRTTLNKLFNQVTGMPIMEYLIKLRAFLASQMLSDTTLPVSEIINRVGFNDPTNFGRMFRKYYGYSATEYREKNCWMLR